MSGRLKGLATRSAVHGEPAEPALPAALPAGDALLVSIPPGGDGDPVLARYAPTWQRSPRLHWIGYLSTVGVYGDHAGAWVDEAASCGRLRARAPGREAEQAWLHFGEEVGVEQVFRLAGIYGPGRSALDNLSTARHGASSSPARCSTAFTSRISPRVLEASIAGRAGAIYNVDR